MLELLKQLASPAILIAAISGLYGYFQNKREEYREQVYESKQRDFNELTSYAEKMVALGPEKTDELKSLLFKISQRINPYGQDIKTFGLYEWLEDDGHIWYKIKDIEDNSDNQKAVTVADLKDLSHRIQVSKRLLDEKIEKSVSPISGAQAGFYLVRYLLVLLNLILFCMMVYDIYTKNQALNTLGESWSIFLTLGLWVLFSPVLIYLLPKLLETEEETKGNTVIAYIFAGFVAVIDGGAVSYLIGGKAGVDTGSFTGAVVFLLMMGMFYFKEQIFKKTGIGKVARIYKEEYKKLQKDSGKIKNWIRKIKNWIRRIGSE